MKLWRQRQANSRDKGNGNGAKSGLGKGIGSASVGHLPLSSSFSSDTPRLSLDSPSPSPLLATPKGRRPRAGSRPKTWVASLIASATNAASSSPLSPSSSQLETASQANARAFASNSAYPAPQPVSSLVLSHDTPMARQQSDTGSSQLSSIAHSQASRSAPSLPLSGTVSRYQDNGALDLLPPRALAPAIGQVAVQRDEASASPLIVRNLDEAPRGAWTPAMPAPPSAVPPTASRLRNPWVSTSEEDDQVDEALAQSRSSNKLAAEEQAVLDMLDSMAGSSQPQQADAHSPKEDNASPASRYSTSFSPAPSDVSFFAKSGASNLSRAKSVKDSIRARETLDRDASTSSRPLSFYLGDAPKPVLTSQTSSSAYYDRSPSPTRSASPVKRVPVPPLNRAPISSASSQLDSPNQSSLISSAAHATSLWSRPSIVPESPGTSHDPQSPTAPSEKWKSSRGPTVTSYALDPPAFRRQTTDWTEATSIWTESRRGSEGKQSIADPGTTTATATATVEAGAELTTEAEVEVTPTPQRVKPPSSALSTLSSSVARSHAPPPSQASASASYAGRASDTGSTTAIKSQGSHLRSATLPEPDAFSSTPRSPIPSSPVKAKDLIRFFESGSASEPTSPTKVSLRSAKNYESEALVGASPGAAAAPLAASYSHSNVTTNSNSSPISAKLRARAPIRPSLRSIALVGAGGGAISSDDTQGGDIDDENTPPSSTPPRSNFGTRSRLASASSGSPAPRPNSMALAPSPGSFGGFERPSHSRAGSTPVGSTLTSSSPGAALSSGGRNFNTVGSSSRASMDQAATTGSSNLPSSGKKAGFPFRNSVRSIVSAFSGRSPSSSQSPAVISQSPAVISPPRGPSSPLDPLEAHNRLEAKLERDADNEDALSVASGMTLGTTASFKQRTETGNLALSSASAVELSGEPPSTEPIRSGVLFYFNVHQREPHWQRVQVVLLPTAIAMSWIPAGGGRENVVLDLRACREVHSVPSPDHPSSISDIGAMRARKQGLHRLNPFQLIFDDGVERLAADSATERVKWVNCIWDVTGVSTPPQQLEMSPSPSTSPNKSAATLNNLPSPRTIPLNASPLRERRPPPPSLGRSSNNEEAIDRIGSIWKSELSSDTETRGDKQPSIAEALATGPPVPPKEPRAARPPPLALALNRSKVRSWRREEDGGREEGFVHEQEVRTPRIVEPDEEVQVRSMPASFADDEHSETQTLNESTRSDPGPGGKNATSTGHGSANGSAESTGQNARETKSELSPASASVPPLHPVAPPATEVAASSTPSDESASRMVHLDAPEDTPQPSGSPSTLGSSPDLDGYESAHSHSSQVDEFGPRTPRSEAVFNWTRLDKDSEIRPSDSASQRPARSEFGTISSKVSYDRRREAAASPKPTLVSGAKRAPPPTELTEYDEQGRTPAQQIRDSVLKPAITMANTPAYEPASRLGTVIEETQSQAQSTRLSKSSGRSRTRQASEPALTSSPAPVSAMSPASIRSGLSNGSINSQDVFRLLEHLEDQQRSRAARDQYFEEQIRNFQDVVTGLQNRPGSVRSRSTSGASKTSSVRDAELAAVQEKLDKVLELVGNVMAQREAPTPRPNSDLARIEGTLEKLMSRMQTSANDMPAELRGSNLARSVHERALHGRDGRHEAIAADMVRSGSVPPSETPRLGMHGASASMSDIDSLASGRIPPRSWVSANGIPSPPPNSEWDEASVRGSTRFGARGKFPPRTPVQNIRMHGDMAGGSTPRPALGPAQASADSLDMELEIRKRRAKHQAASGQPEAAGWYTPKPASGEEADAMLPPEPVTPGVRWAPGDEERRSFSTEGLGLSLPSSKVGAAEAATDGSVSPTVVGGNTRRGSMAPSGELGTVLEALKQNELARQSQIKQQAEIARYLNELNAWLERDVVDRSKEWRTLASGVTQLHEELLALKTGRVPKPAAEAPPAPTMQMPVPVITMANSPREAPPATPVATNPHESAAPPPSPLRPGGPRGPKGPAPPSHIPFGNGGRWTNLATPNLNNGFTSSPRKPQTRTWHASPAPGEAKNEDAWYRPDDIIAPSRESFLKSKGGRLAAGVGGALLVRAALREWDKFKAKQRSEGKPEDPLPAGATGDPVADAKIPLPPPIEEKLKSAADAGSEDGVTTVVREAAEQGLGTQAIRKLTEHVEAAELDGETLGAPTPSPHRTRFVDAPEVYSDKASNASVSASASASGVESASNSALALAVEEILKHLLEKKEEEKRLQEVKAVKAQTEEEKREKDKAELVELILTRLNADKAKVDPKSAIESLVAALNAQNTSRASTDQALREMATTILEQNSKLVESVHSAARDMLRHNVDAHAEELKRQLGRDVATMFDDVGKIREAKRALENEMAELFAIKARHLAWAPPTAIAMPQPQPQATIMPYASPVGVGMGMSEKAMKKAAKAAVKSALAKEEPKKEEDKPKPEAAKVEPAPAEAPKPVAVPAILPAFFAPKKDVLKPFSVNFGPREPR